MKKRLIASVTCLCLLLIMLLSSTLAWFTDQTEATKSTMTVGNVEILQLEQYRDAEGNLQPWHPVTGASYAPQLWPAVADLNTGVLASEKYVINGQEYTLYNQDQSVYDKIVSVKNTGSDSAFVRTVFAFEMMKTEQGWENPIGKEVLLNYNENQQLTFPKTADGKDVIIYRKDAQGEVELAFVIGVATYAKLDKGAVSAPSLLQFYLDQTVGNEFIAAVGEQYEILALSQAVQTAGFGKYGAANALNTAFGVVNASNAALWFGESYDEFDKPIITVGSAQEAQTALDNLESGSIIKLAPNVNYGTLEISAQVVSENKKPVANNDNTEAVDYFTSKYPTGEFVRTFNDITIIGAPGAKVDAIKFVTGTFKVDIPETGKQSGTMYRFVEINNLVIDGVEFTGNSELGAGAGYVSPIFMDLQSVKVNGLTVKNCKLEGYKSNMNFVYAYGNAAKDCTFGVTLKNVSIIGNTVSGIARLCELREAENVTITGNKVANCTRELALLANNTDQVYSGDIIVSGNIVDRIASDYVAAGKDGLFFRVGAGGTANITVKDNVITNSGCVEASFVGVTGHTGTLTVENNTFN